MGANNWPAVNGTQGDDSLVLGVWQQITRRINGLNEVFFAKKEPEASRIRRWAGNCPVCGRFQDSMAICADCRSDDFDA